MWMTSVYNIERDVQFYTLLTCCRTNEREGTCKATLILEFLERGTINKKITWHKYS